MTALLKVHLMKAPEPHHLGHLQGLLDPRVRITMGAEPPMDASYELLVAGVPSRDLMEASAHLRTLIIPWAGLPGSTRDLALAFPHVAVHNLHHNAGPTAEAAMALLLAAAKFVVPMDRALRNDDWSPRYAPDPSLLLEGKTILILGYGAIGSRVGRACRGLGMTVKGIRRSVSHARREGPEEIHPLAALPELLPQAHALVVCLPHTVETRGLISQRELSLLPRGAVLVNVGRGPIVNEKALYEALRDGHLRAAGIDVWYSYPEDEASRSGTAPSAWPFHTLDNVVMSPHRAGAFGADETERLRMEALAELLNAAARTEVLPNRVDLEHGY